MPTFQKQPELMMQRNHLEEESQEAARMSCAAPNSARSKMSVRDTDPTLHTRMLFSLHNPVARAARALAGRYTGSVPV